MEWSSGSLSGSCPEGRGFESHLHNQGCNPIMIDPHFLRNEKAGYTSDSFKNTAMCLIGGMIHMIGIQKSISEETPPERVGAN